MIKCVLTDISKNEYVFFNPKSLTLIRERNVPADSLDVLFLSDMSDIEYAEIVVFDDARCVFRGIVDEQIETVFEGGFLLEINARSLAALLLDNEAMPQSCCLPNMQLFMERNFYRLGFKEYIGNDHPKSGSMSIAKGTSEWSVLEQYCKKFLNTYPRVNEDGVIDVSGSDGETIVLTNEGEYKIISLSRVKKRCELISEYRVRTLRGNGYEMIINNENADRLGVNSVRYLNTVDNKSVGIASCYENIKESNRLYDTVKLNVSGRVLANIGDWIVLPDYGLGNLRVYKLRYELDGDNEVTMLELYKEVEG